jgi:hypothetical protein
MARKKPPEQVAGRYSAMPHLVLDSVAFAGASHTAKALLYELMRQHSGSNNGHLQLATGWLKKRGWNSHDVLQRAKLELVTRRLISKTRSGGLNAGCDQWALTWLQISNFVGLDVRPGGYHPGAWMHFEEDARNQKKPSVCRDSAIPANGTTGGLAAPAAGTKTTNLMVVAIPRAGNNVSNHVPTLSSNTKRIVGKPGKSGTRTSPIEMIRQPERKSK